MSRCLRGHSAAGSDLRGVVGLPHSLVVVMGRRHEVALDGRIQLDVGRSQAVHADYMGRITPDAGCAALCAEVSASDGGTGFLDIAVPPVIARRRPVSAVQE